MTRPTCGDCGSPMRQTFTYLTFKDGCDAVPTGLVCSSNACRERQLEQDRADRKQRDEQALERALASGLIVPDDTPEEDRYV